RYRVLDVYRVSFLLHLLACSASCATRPLPASSFFFTCSAAAGVYTLSLHDALPISRATRCARTSTARGRCCSTRARARACSSPEDRKSTRLNSSHVAISYAVFCLKKKKSQCLGVA